MINPYRELSQVNPQCDNGHGYRRINNEVLQALIESRLTGSEYSICLFIIDRSWGFQELSAPISLTQFEKATNLARPNINKALQRLADKKIIVIQKYTGRTRNEYLFNKHYDTWVTSNVERTSNAQRTTTGTLKKEKKIYKEKDISISFNKNKNNGHKKSDPDGEARARDPDRFRKGTYGDLVCSTADDVKRLQEYRKGE